MLKTNFYQHYGEGRNESTKNKNIHTDIDYFCGELSGNIGTGLSEFERKRNKS